MSTLFTSNIYGHGYCYTPLPLVYKAPQFLSFSVPRSIVARSDVSTRVKRTPRKKKQQLKDKDTAAPVSAAEKSLRYAFMDELMLLARKRDTAGVSDVLSDMIAAGLKPGPRSFHGLIVSHVLNHDLQGAMHSLKRELSTGLRPLHETFVALLRLYASRGEATGGFEILSAMDKFNYDIRPAWIFLVEELVRNNHLEKANEVFLKGSKGGMIATDELYDLLIVEDCKVGDHSNALDVAYEMEASGRMATTFHFNWLLSVQATCGIPEMAYTTFENMEYAGEEFMKPDTETYNWVFQAYTRAESYDRLPDVSELLGMMLEDHKRVQPNARTHALLVECFTKYGLVREAIRHYRALANFEGGTKLLYNEGKFGDPLSLYLRALCGEGRIVELLEALDAMAKDKQPIPPRAMIVSRKYRTLVSSWIEPLLEEADHGFEIDYISRYIAEGGLTGERKRWVPRSGNDPVDPDAEGFIYANPVETSFKQRCLEDWKTHHAKVFRFLRNEGRSALGDATESDYKRVMDRLKKITTSPSKRVLKPKAASNMLVAELKEELEAQDLPTDGTRNVLYQRVQKARRINLSRGMPLWIPPVKEEEEEVDEEIEELILRVDLQEGNTEFWKRRFLGEGLNVDHGKPIDVDALETLEESDDDDDDDDTEEVEDDDAEEEEVERTFLPFGDEDAEDEDDDDSPLQMLGTQLLQDSEQTTRISKKSRRELRMLSNDKDGDWFPFDINGALKELREREFFTESDMYTLADAWGWTWERELRSRPPQRWSQEWEVELSIQLMQKVIELGGTPTIGDCAMILRAAIRAPMPSVFLKILQTAHSLGYVYGSPLYDEMILKCLDLEELDAAIAIVADMEATGIQVPSKTLDMVISAKQSAPIASDAVC